MKYLFSLSLLVLFLSTIKAQNWQTQQTALQQMVLVENKKNFLPIINLESLNLVLIDHSRVSKDSNATPHLYQTLSYYTAIQALNAKDWKDLVQKKTKPQKAKPQKNKSIAPPTIWIVAYSGTDSLAAQTFYAQIDTAAQQAQTQWVAVVLNNEKYLPVIEQTTQLAAVLLTFGAGEEQQSLAAQCIFGAVCPKGRMPVTIGKYKQGYGLSIPQLSRLQYTYPEAVGATQALNLRIDSLITNALQQKAMPSCQVLVAVKGKVFLHKSYGFHTFDSLQATQWNSLYDLASVTKILAGTLAIMKLHENQQFNLDKNLGTTFPLLKKTDKANITWRDLLAHQAKVPAGIPFWQFTLDKKGKLDKKLYTRNRTAQFSWQVADSLFTTPSVQNIYLKAFKNAVLLPQKQYLYSDLPFVLTALAVSQKTKLRLDEYVYRNFYKSLGTNYLLFNPLQTYKKEMIVPTEYDSTFRQQLVHGTVHDESAALLGGVSGNAGLFGNANDVAKILQLFLQNGEYGGKNYLQSATLHEFTRCQYCWEQAGNFRGLGFNRQIFTPNPNSHAAVSATEQSFGHTGFTGTYTWVDKEYDLVYVFLSNRVYPTRKNQKLMELNLRTQILEEVYQALRKN